MITIIEKNEIKKANPQRTELIMLEVERIKNAIKTIPENGINATIYLNILDSEFDEELAINLSIESDSESFKDLIEDTINS